MPFAAAPSGRGLHGRTRSPPRARQELWPELARLPSHFVLYGGTGIALRLGHRVSVDFDFFSDVALDEDGKRQLLALFRIDSILQNDRNTLVFDTLVGDQPVKLSFFGGLANGCVSQPDMTEDGIACIASLDDLLAHKLEAIHDRAEGKDYQDIAVILMHGHALERGLAARETLFGTEVPSMLTLKALTFFSDVSEPERLSPEMRRAITAAVQHLPERWPPILLLSRTLADGCGRWRSMPGSRV